MYVQNFLSFTDVFITHVDRSIFFSTARFRYKCHSSGNLLSVFRSTTDRLPLGLEVHVKSEPLQEFYISLIKRLLLFFLYYVQWPADKMSNFGTNRHIGHFWTVPRVVLIHNFAVYFLSGSFYSHTVLSGVCEILLQKHIKLREPFTYNDILVGLNVYVFIPRAKGLKNIAISLASVRPQTHSCSLSYSYTL